MLAVGVALCVRLAQAEGPARGGPPVVATSTAQSGPVEHQTETQPARPLAFGDGLTVGGSDCNVGALGILPVVTGGAKFCAGACGAGTKPGTSPGGLGAATSPGGRGIGKLSKSCAPASVERADSHRPTANP